MDWDASLIGSERRGNKQEKVDNIITNSRVSGGGRRGGENLGRAGFWDSFEKTRGGLGKGDPGSAIKLV